MKPLVITLTVKIETVKVILKRLLQRLRII